MGASVQNAPWSECQHRVRRRPAEGFPVSSLDDFRRHGWYCRGWFLCPNVSHHPTIGDISSPTDVCFGDVQLNPPQLLPVKSPQMEVSSSSWGIPNWLVFVRENPYLEMDDDWGYPHFRKPPSWDGWLAIMVDFHRLPHTSISSWEISWIWDGSLHGTTRKITLLRVIPTMTFNSSHLTIYLAYLSGKKKHMDDNWIRPKWLFGHLQRSKVISWVYQWHWSTFVQRSKCDFLGLPNTGRLVSSPF